MMFPLPTFTANRVEVSRALRCKSGIILQLYDMKNLNTPISATSNDVLPFVAL